MENQLSDEFDKAVADYNKQDQAQRAKTDESVRHAQEAAQQRARIVSSWDQHVRGTVSQQLGAFSKELEAKANVTFKEMSKKQVMGLPTALRFEISRAGDGRSYGQVTFNATDDGFVTAKATMPLSLTFDPVPMADATPEWIRGIGQKVFIEFVKLPKY